MEPLTLRLLPLPHFFLNSLLPSPEEVEQPCGLALIAGAGGTQARLGHQLPLTTHTAETLP